MEKFTKAIQKEEKVIKDIRSKKLEVTQRIGQLKQRKVKLFTDGYHGEEKEARERVIELDLMEAQEELDALTRQEVRVVDNMNQSLAPEVEKLKAERSKKVADFNEKIEEAEAQLLEMKRVMLQELEKLHMERLEYIEEVDEMNNAISKFERNDRKPKLKEIHALDYGTSYLFRGGDAPCMPTQSEIEGVLRKDGSRYPEKIMKGHK